MAANGTISSDSIRFGEEFEFDPGAYELRRAGQSIKLGRTPMTLLLLLVEHRGRLVSREQIIEKVWGKGVFIDTDNGINATIRRIRQTLEDDSEQPRFIQTVIGRGYRFIATIEDTGSPIPEIPTTAPAPDSQIDEKKSLHRNLRGTVSLGASTVVLLLVVGIVSLNIESVRALLFHSVTSGESATSFHARPSIAVLGFKNLSQKEEESWISNAMAELLSADLAAGQQLRIIPGEDVARMKVDLPLPVAETYSRDTLTKVRSRLGTDMVGLGSYLAGGRDGGQKIRINLQVQDARTGETVAAVSEDGIEADLAELVSRSGHRLRTVLRVNAVTSNDGANVRAGFPANSKAARFYAEALRKLRGFDHLMACDLVRSPIRHTPPPIAVRAQNP